MAFKRARLWRGWSRSVPIRKWFPDMRVALYKVLRGDLLAACFECGERRFEWELLTGWFVRWRWRDWLRVLQLRRSFRGWFRSRGARR